jgi:hypothetical protein
VPIPLNFAFTIGYRVGELSLFVLLNVNVDFGSLEIRFHLTAAFFDLCVELLNLFF